MTVWELIRALEQRAEYDDEVLIEINSIYYEISEAWALTASKPHRYILSPNFANPIDPAQNGPAANPISNVG